MVRTSVCIYLHAKLNNDECMRSVSPRFLVYISRWPIDLAIIQAWTVARQTSFALAQLWKITLALIWEKFKNYLANHILMETSSIFKRLQVLLIWFLLVLASQFDTGFARALLKLRPSPWKIPLKEAENPIWRDPPGELFRQQKSKLLQVPNPDSNELKKIIKKFEPRYMSIAKPDGNATEVEAQTFKRREIFARMPAELKNMHFTVPGSDRELGGRASRKLRLWLWNLSSCKVLPLWKDFGPTIWPRYVNIGQCETKNSCSYPSGMKCKPAKYKRIYTLFWVCSEQIRKRKGTLCIWVPYPTDVVEKCKCSC